MALRLDYVLTPQPNPVRASPEGGGNPNVVDLAVLVSNPGLNAAAVDRIVIHIPVGGDSNRTLSAAKDLPQPRFDTSSGWSMTSAGGDVTLIPPHGRVAGAVELTLPGIAINTKPGVVPITITETPDGDPVPDASRLVKKPSDFVVTSFAATQATLHDLDQRVVLRWTVTPAGEDLLYSVHSDSWHPVDCLDGGRCFDAADGARGIQTEPLNGTTTFALDVIATDPEGHRSIQSTVVAKVRVEVPQISPSVRVGHSVSGRLARLHWLAWNASRCVLHVNGVDVDERAPIDTYEHGWYALLPERPVRHTFGVTAMAPTGNATAFQGFPDLETSEPVTIPFTDHHVSKVAVAASGTFAVVGLGDGPLWGIDLPAGRLQTQPLAEIRARDVAVTADASLALVADINDGALSAIHVATREVVGIALPGEAPAFFVAVSPDGRLAFASSFRKGLVFPIDLATFRAVGTGIATGQGPTRCAFTPDSKTMFVCNGEDRTIAVIDVGSLSPVGPPIKLSGNPTAIAVTADGARAVVAEFASHGGAIESIDTATREVTLTAPLAHAPDHMALTPDGHLAFLVDATPQTSLAVVDVRSGEGVGALALDDNAHDVAIAPDGSVLLAATQSSVTVL